MKNGVVANTTKYLESAVESNLDFIVEEHNLVQDLKMLMRDVYVATYTNDESSLKLCFNNGQRFLITVKEIH